MITGHLAAANHNERVKGFHGKPIHNVDIGVDVVTSDKVDQFIKK